MPLSNCVPRGFGFVHHSIAVLYREVPSPNLLHRWPAGETGCGKSTLIPLLLLRAAEARGESCRVVVTQPRRIAATSLAARVASLMPERIGQSVRGSVAKQLRIVMLGFGWEVGHGAVTLPPADFPLHDGTPYRGLRARRWRLGFVHNSRTILLSRRAKH